MDKDKTMDITDFPKEIVKDMYAIVEYKGTEKEHFVYAYPSEIKAYKIAKRLSHNNVSVFKANIVFHIVDDIKIMCGYEED